MALVSSSLVNDHYVAWTLSTVVQYALLTSVRLRTVAVKGGGTTKSEGGVVKHSYSTWG